MRPAADRRRSYHHGYAPLLTSPIALSSGGSHAATRMASIIPISDVRSAVNPNAHRDALGRFRARRRQCRTDRSGSGGGCARAHAPRSAHIGHRPLQLPLRLLHAEGRVRRRLPVPASRGPAHVRGDRARRPDLRRARRFQDPADRRRAADAPQRRAPGRDAGQPRRRRPHADDQRRAAREEGAQPRRRRPDARDGEPRFARRRDVPRDERRRLSRRQGPRRHRRGGGRRAQPAQDQHGGETRHQRCVDRADGTALQGHGPHRPLHRIHGRRRDQRLADGRRRSRRGGRPGDRRGAAARKRGSELHAARSRSAGGTRTAAARSA